jgi:hypothetical protein
MLAMFVRVVELELLNLNKGLLSCENGQTLFARFFEQFVAPPAWKCFVLHAALHYQRR